MSKSEDDKEETVFGDISELDMRSKKMISIEGSTCPSIDIDSRILIHNLQRRINEYHVGQILGTTTATISPTLEVSAASTFPFEEERVGIKKVLHEKQKTKDHFKKFSSKKG